MLRNWLLKSQMARHLAVWNPEQERDILIDTGGPRSEGGYDSEPAPSPTQVQSLGRRIIRHSIPHYLTFMIAKKTGP